MGTKYTEEQLTEREYTDEQIADLVAQGYRSTSNRYRSAARLPVDLGPFDGIQALERRDRRLAQSIFEGAAQATDAELRRFGTHDYPKHLRHADESAGDYYRRCCATDRERITFRCVADYRAFRKAGGARGEVNHFAKSQGVP